MAHPINPELREQIIKAMPHMYGDCEDCHADLKRVINLVAKAITEAEQGAREDQIMQDFLSLTVDYGGDIDEVHLIGWRDDRLAELTTKKEAQ